jgi:hypothetical protein
MTREDAEKLVYDLTDACRDYERAEGWQIRRAREDYKEAVRRVIDALVNEQ